MWYPPRTVNEQLEYKKALFKAVQNLELLGRLPKNTLISKGTIMGDTTVNAIVEFLRFLSQMALRYDYINKYSHKERLIQIACNSSYIGNENNINKFYIHPFVPNSISTFEHSSVNIGLLLQVYHDYLKIYFRKLVKLRTRSVTPVLADLYQKTMKDFIQQKQLSESVSRKIPQALLSENRAFDRRRLIDRNQEIWAELDKM